MRIFIFIIITMFFGVAQVNANEVTYESLKLKRPHGLSEAEFDVIMTKFVNVFSPYVLSNYKKHFFIEKKWNETIENAFASRTSNAYSIIVYGGLIRYPGTTPDGMVLSLCHELGHNLGGLPKLKDPTWSSSEGQADYWASMKCLKEYFSSDNNIEIVKYLSVPQKVKKDCMNAYANENEIAICKRSIMAGLDVALMLNSGPENKTQVSLQLTDTNVVAKTYISHPEAQCRLDTYYQGALCDHTILEKSSFEDESIGVCSEKNGNLFGLRPKCWYKSKL